MALTRFLTRLRIRRMQRRMRERIALVVILGLFMLCCCLSFWLGMVNYTLRDVLGILPTFTPSPVPTQTLPPTQPPVRSYVPDMKSSV